jgi:hypothetical protein
MNSFVREKNACQPAPAGDQNGILGPKQASGFVAKFPYCADAHVVTCVTILTRPQLAVASLREEWVGALQRKILGIGILALTD